METNRHDSTVAGFGFEWKEFDQSKLTFAERDIMFAQYFSLFPLQTLDRTARGMDIGCGSGRWAYRVAPLVGTLFCVDASAEALSVARRNLGEFANCEFIHASVENIPVPDESLDFAYSLGVLHHIPDTALGIVSCARKLKAGAPFLVYLYYDFENRARWFRLLWRASDMTRMLVSRLPNLPKLWISQVIAAAVYWPLARLARVCAKLGINTASFPLNAYKDRSFYVMRTDALDRFGTRLEKRFSLKAIQAMLEAAGLERVQFRKDAPFWCAIAYRA